MPSLHSRQTSNNPMDPVESDNAKPEAVKENSPPYRLEMWEFEKKGRSPVTRGNKYLTHTTPNK